jgi:hypothetical protein
VESNGINNVWNVFISVAAIAGVINIMRAVNKPSQNEINEYERIIEEKDKIIKQQAEKLLKYKELYDTRERNKLE